ncbi:hypothetical protein Ngar_c20050 [Candidatus Nitrososphaera gargensis Ga9.2]|uniref:Transmembrane protein n=1 Tax=Nitrososphaera gargensis (strain Ga9.2) TaxID=1237085 RepID=K0IKH6_NITGG|nr:hypothetical protein [Candidatus Nitrososphaera gargensis]AFU58937.1 hypothetical protein Ngar_c20050 [Candidatus Nitrososphaera gargensis Ga9.2]
MNKTTVLVGISFIVAAVVLVTMGFLEWFAHENCMEIIRAFERGESNVLPACPPEPSGKFLIAALPVGIGGAVILVMGVKNRSLLSSPKPQSK